jgi:hypothetical protein
MISKRLVIFVALVIAVSAADLFAQPAAKNFYDLTNAAPAAFRAGDMTKASSLANMLIAEASKFENDWNYCNAIHVGHLVLGRVALADGDVKEAKSQLLKSVQGPGGPDSTKDDVQFKGSPQMISFGPDMLLAQELLAKGEKDAVLKYLDLCATFWQKKFSKVDEWKSQINKGENPSFGPNLVYFFH